MSSPQGGTWKILVTGPPLCSEAMNLLKAKAEVITMPPIERS